MNIIKKPFFRSLTTKLYRNIASGDSVPAANVSILTLKNGQYEKDAVNTSQYFAKGKFVVVGFPGAFTPTCTATHIPEYIQRASELQAAGAKIFAMAVNDPFVLKAFAESLGGKDKIGYLADGNAEFTKALDAGLDLSAAGLGFRSRRFSLLIEDGKVVQFNDEQGPKLTDVSKVSQILGQLKNKK